MTVIETRLRENFPAILMTLVSLIVAGVFILALIVITAMGKRTMLVAIYLFLLMFSGFVIESVEVDHIFPYKIADYKEYRYVKEWYWRLLGKRAFRWLEKKIGWHLLVIARKPNE